MTLTSNLTFKKKQMMLWITFILIYDDIIYTYFNFQKSTFNKLEYNKFGYFCNSFHKVKHTI